MINYIQGDLLTTPDNIIVHGVNCQGKMGAGVAAQIKARYPEAYQVYENNCTKARDNAFKNGCLPADLLLGNIDVVGCFNKMIVNCYTQDLYGRDGAKYVSYDAVDDCMLKIAGYMVQFVERDGTLPKISMPKIGAGLGGGNWDVIEKIIIDRLYHTSVVTVWEL